MRRDQDICDCGDLKKKTSERCVKCHRAFSALQPCLNGHDINEVGRSSSGNCNECQRERMRTDDYKEYQTQRRESLRKMCPDCGETIDQNSDKCRPCWGKSIRGESNHLWKGGKLLKISGYVEIWAPGHPRRKGNYVSEHVIVMEEHLGRYLEPGENVHHLNGIRDDNRIENLELWSTSQPAGQRVEDKVNHALEILKLYAPDYLNKEML